MDSGRPRWRVDLRGQTPGDYARSAFAYLDRELWRPRVERLRLGAQNAGLFRGVIASVIAIVLIWMPW